MTTPVNPTDPRQLRASDADRNKVAEALHVAAGEGRIDLDELQDRLDAVYQAKTYADLEPVTQDLPGAMSATPVPIPVSGPTPVMPGHRIGGTPVHSSSVAILSGAERKGRWVVPERYSCFALCGGINLDLREAMFAGPVVTIEASAFMGGVDIIVPEDVTVDVHGSGIMGGFEDLASGPGAPGAPVVRITGMAVWGGIRVRRKRLHRDQLPGQP